MQSPFRITDHILFEDDFIIVLNKPHGLMVEPDRNGYANLQQLLKKYLKTSDSSGEVYAQHIHRLDRPVSGVILFAKQKSVLKNLSEQFAERRVKKYYQAMTTASPSQNSGVLENWFRKEKKKAVLHDEEVPFAERVKLDYTVRELAAQQFLWDIQLHTGKYHQIRAQLSYVNCPIIGDGLYGSTISYKDNAIALHACRLIFHHPLTNEEMSIGIQNDFARA